jgi:transcriptional regulator with XRE-family HTH domain
VPILDCMVLKDILLPKGVVGPSDLGRRLGISKQHASLLWNGNNLPSLEMAQRIRERLGVSLDELAELERREPLKRRGPKPKPRSSGRKQTKGRGSSASGGDQRGKPE